jgi:hypothetical protein
VTTRRRRAELLPQAKQDIELLAGDDPQVAKVALRTIKDLEARRIEGEPLHDMAAAGDRSDCRKLYFGVGSPPSHRIVYRELGEREIEVVEVVAVEARDELYVHLLASLRLGRLPAESQPRLNRVHQSLIERRSRQKRDRQPPPP